MSSFDDLTSDQALACLRSMHATVLAGGDLDTYAPCGHRVADALALHLVAVNQQAAVAAVRTSAYERGAVDAREMYDRLYPSEVPA